MGIYADHTVIPPVLHLGYGQFFLTARTVTWAAVPYDVHSSAERSPRQPADGQAPAGGISRIALLTSSVTLLLRVGLMKIVLRPIHLTSVD